MSRVEIIEQIDELIKKCNGNNRTLSVVIRNKYKELYEAILSETSFLIDDPKCGVQKDGSRVQLIARIFAIKNGITKQPKCRVCGNPAFYNNFQKRFSNWCSISCSVRDKETIALRDKTTFERHGDKNFRNSKKTKNTRIEKYGSYHPSDMREKTESTKLKRYGDKNFSNVEKQKATKLLKYGNENFVNVEKGKFTKLKLYGDENFNNRKKFKETISEFSDEKKNVIKEKRKLTNLNKYGTEYATQNSDVRKHTKNTMLEKYGVSCGLCTKTARDRMRRKITERSLKTLLSFAHTNDLELVTNKEEFLSCCNQSKTQLTWRCKKCGTVFTSRYDNGMCIKLCPKCFTDDGRSEQHEIFEFVQSLLPMGTEISVNNRSVLGNLELDFYIPSRKIAIEFNGLFWHCELKKDKGYHLNKTEMCDKKGIRLIHIFEDEWLFKRKIVKSRIRGFLSSKRKIFARKCEVREISNSVKSEFVEKYHIQGDDVSAIRYGLFYHGHLVSVMTFCKSRFNKNFEYELSRYVTVSNFTVVGGAGKLLKHFERTVNPSSIITYADRRWSCGDLYLKLGFEHIGNSYPSFYYTKGLNRYNRMDFQKHMLENKLKNVDMSKSEHEIMNENGYFRIYDCGNMIFGKRYCSELPRS